MRAQPVGPAIPILVHFAALSHVSYFLIAIYLIWMGGEREWMMTSAFEYCGNQTTYFYDDSKLMQQSFHFGIFWGWSIPNEFTFHNSKDAIFYFYHSPFTLTALCVIWFYLSATTCFPSINIRSVFRTSVTGHLILPWQVGSMHDTHPARLIESVFATDANECT